MIPDKVKEALSNYKPTQLNNFPNKDIPEYGDIVIYKQNILFVEKVWEEHSNCWMVHTFPEWITKYDFLISQDESGLNYPLVVQMDLVVNVFHRDIDNYISNVNVPKQVVNNSFKGNGVGLSIGGPLSSLWEFKSRQGDICNNLTADCTAYLLERG